MGKLKVGVMIESFRLGVKKGIEKAAEIGADGFQIYTTHGEMAPDNMTQTARKQFVRFVERCGLTISALCGDYGKGFGNPESVDKVVEDTKKIVDLAVDLGVQVITTHIGVVSEDPNDPSLAIMRDALSDVGTYAINRERFLATETGPEHGRVLREFIDSLDNEGIKVNFDPANLVMMGYDVLESLEALGPLVVHTHAKDGVRNPDGTHKEVPLGEGQVPWPEYLAMMESIGYDGFFTIEREVGENPVADIVKAVKFLRSF